MLRYIPLLFPLALANCGDILASLEALERADELDRLEALIANSGESGLTPLSDAEIESRTGTVSYPGQAAIVIPGNNSPDYVFSARANINADFASNTLTAEFNDWIGYQDGDNLAESSVQGGVDFTDGVIGGDFAAQISGNVTGDITADGRNVTIDGVMDGQIAGFDGGEGIGALTVPEQTTITQNGVVIPDAEFGFAGER